jgi:hypothetical protein
MSYKQELDEKLVDCKMSLETEKFPEFHPIAHQISSYQTGEVPFIISFTENVRCTLTHKINQ